MLTRLARINSDEDVFDFDAIRRHSGKHPENSVQRVAATVANTLG